MPYHLGHVGDKHAEQFCTDVINPHTPNPVQVDNDIDIQVAEQFQFQLSSKLSIKSQSGHNYNDLKSVTLISVGQLCNYDCVSFSLNTISTYLKMENSLSKTPVINPMDYGTMY